MNVKRASYDSQHAHARQRAESVRLRLLQCFRGTPGKASLIKAPNVRSGAGGFCRVGLCAGGTFHFPPSIKTLQGKADGGPAAGCLRRRREGSERN
jgi:hypothetical protein